MSIIKESLTKTVYKYTDTTYNFSEIFNPSSGLYIRGNCKDTNKDPQLRSFPALLDIGIVGGCKTCTLCPVDCYQGGKSYNPDNDMTLDNYKKLIDEGSIKGLQQVALGGAGNPNDHQYFREILQYTREKDIVPNYTTSGISLTDESVSLTKEYCGAVAVSWYYQQFTVDAINKFLKVHMKTSIHFVLSKSTIKDAINLLRTGILKYKNHNDTLKEFNVSESNINAVIFLLYKPVGLGTKNLVLNVNQDDNLLKEFFELIDTNTSKFKIGFDSCSVPAILNYSKHISKDSIDTCEGARFSAYINPNMIMTPCSFDQNLYYGVQLNDSVSIEDAWNSSLFKNFRSKLCMNCIDCKQFDDCRSGCSLMNSIVLCKNIQK